MSSHKLMVIVLLSLLWMANVANADWQPYSSPVNGPTYGTSDGLSAVDWNNSTYLVSSDYHTGIYYSTDEGESWTLGDEVHGTNATFIITNPYIDDHVYIARDAQGEEGFWVSQNGGVDFIQRNGTPPNDLSNTSITSIYIDPNTPHDIYATCAAIGTDDDRIFKTTDEGESWTAVFDNYPPYDDPYELDITAMYILPGSSAEVWVGSGGLTGGEESELVGVWRSEDGGDNWEQELGGEQVGLPGVEYYPHRSVRKIIQNPNFPEETAPYCITNSIRIYEATNLPDICLYRLPSESAGDLERIFRMMGHLNSDTWEKFNSFQLTKENSSGDIYCFFTLSHEWDGVHNPSYLDAGVIRVDISGPPNYFFESLHEGIFVPYAISLAIDPIDNTMIYAGTRGGPYGEPSFEAYGGVFKTTDFGDNWYDITKGMHTCASLDLFFHGGTLWAGGSQPDPPYQGNMLTAKNPGEPWSNRFVHGSNSFRDFVVGDGYVGDEICLAVGAENVGEDSIYFSYDGGIYFEADFGQEEPSLQAHAYAVANYDHKYYATFDQGTRIVKKDIPSSPTWQPFDTNLPVGDGALGIYASPSRYVWTGTANYGIWSIFDPDPISGWTYKGLSGLDDISTILVYSTGAGTDSVLARGFEHNTNNASVYWSPYGGSSWANVIFTGQRDFVKGWAFHPSKRYVIAATTEDDQGNPYVFLSLSPYISFRDFSEGLDPNIIHQIKDIVFTSTPAVSNYTLNVGTDAGIFKRPLIIATPVITSDTGWTSENPIFVLGDLTIPSGKTLTIEPGTKVYFAPDYDEESSGLNHNRCEIIVNGTLEAEGSEGSKIVFEPWTATDERWGGIVAYGTVNLDNCEIKSAGDAFVAFENSIVNLNACNISNSYTGVTAFYPEEMNISGTNFENCGDYAIQLQNLYAQIIMTEISISGEFKDGIRYFGNDPEAFLQIDGAEITKEPSFDGTGIFIAADDEKGERPICMISNALIMGFEHGIYLSDAIEGSQIGPNVRSENNINGILLENAWAEIDGSEGVNNFEGNQVTGFLGYYPTGRVRYSKFIGSPLCVYIEKNGDVIDFGLDDPEEEWGNNSIVANPEITEMLFYVDDCQFDYPAQMNWWGRDDKEYVESMVSDCVVWDPLESEAPPDPKLASENINLPKNLTLSQAYPNPFNANVTIKFTLPKATMTSVTVYNILGQEICRLYNEYTQAGEKSVIWDGRDNAGSAVASGVYLYAVRTEGEVKVNKMMLLK